MSEVNAMQIKYDSCHFIYLSSEYEGILIFTGYCFTKLSEPPLVVPVMAEVLLAKVCMYHFPEVGPFYLKYISHQHSGQDQINV